MTWGKKDSAQDEKKLRSWFLQVPFALISFSGGVDSSLVAFVAVCQLGAAQVLAVMADSCLHKRKEASRGIVFCRRHKIPLSVVDTDELNLPSFTDNSPDRCYHCKRLILEAVSSAAPMVSAVLITGTNLDDSKDYRPGGQAELEAGARAPLAEVGMGKKEVRALSRRLGLEDWFRPAEPCLATRVPYGEKITRKKLWMIEGGESLLESSGFSPCRVRIRGNIASLEVPVNDLDRLFQQRSYLDEQFKQLGFSAIKIDPEGFVSGKLNRELDI